MKTSLNEFYQHLKKKETQLFDINTDLNIDSALPSHEKFNHQIASLKGSGLRSQS